MDTCLTDGACAEITAPGYCWSQRKLRIFQKAMELEDNFRCVPCRSVSANETIVAPLPCRTATSMAQMDADHIRLLPPQTTEAYATGLQSAEGQKLNGDHGPVMEHHVKTESGQVGSDR